MQEVGTMIFSELIKKLQKSRVKILNLKDLKKLFGIKKDNTAYKVAEKLIKKEFLLPLKKGIYASTFREPSDFEIANCIYTPSYISLESALNYYGILSQFPYTITSAAAKKTRRFEVKGKEYEYTQISKKLFWGMRKEKEFLIATPEKALLDAIYLAAKGARRFDFKEFDYSKINRSKFRKLSRNIKYLPFQNLLKGIKI